MRVGYGAKERSVFSVETLDCEVKVYHALSFHALRHWLLGDDTNFIRSPKPRNPVG